MSKTIQALLKTAETKEHAKRGAYSLTLKQGQFLRLEHYGSMIVKIDFTTTPVSYEYAAETHTSKVAANFILKQFKLNTYKNTLKGFKEFIADTPTFFSDDDVPGSHEYSYDRSTKIFKESLKRVSFLNGAILDHSSEYKYDEETGRFKCL